MVRRRSRPRRPDRVRPDGIHRHGAGAARRYRHAGAHPQVAPRRSATARAAIRARRTPITPGWPSPKSPTPTTRGRLLEAGVKEDLSTEVKWIREQAEKTENTYVDGPGRQRVRPRGRQGRRRAHARQTRRQAASRWFARRGDHERRRQRRRGPRRSKRRPSRSWRGSRTSTTSSNVEKSIKYLAESCKAGRFGSTQIDRPRPEGDRRLRQVAGEAEAPTAACNSSSTARRSASPSPSRRDRTARSNCRRSPSCSRRASTTCR